MSIRQQSPPVNQGVGDATNQKEEEVKDQKQDEEDKDDELISTECELLLLRGRSKLLLRWKQWLWVMITMLIVMVYLCSSDQNKRVDQREVKLSVVLSDSFQQFLIDNNGKFEIDFDSVFIEYQTIQLENIQSNLFRYFLSLFDELVFGYVHDGKIINEQEQVLLDQCKKKHMEKKEEIQNAIDRLSSLGKKQFVDKIESIILSIQDIRTFLNFKIHQLSSALEINNNNSTNVNNTNEYKHLDYVKLCQEQIIRLESWISTDITDSKYQQITYDAIQEEIQVLVNEMNVIYNNIQLLVNKHATQYSIASKRTTQAERDTHFEDSMIIESDLRQQVFKIRRQLKLLNSQIASNSQLISQSYKNDIKSQIQNLVDSYFSCIST